MIPNETLEKRESATVQADQSTDIAEKEKFEDLISMIRLQIEMMNEMNANSSRGSCEAKCVSDYNTCMEWPLSFYTEWEHCMDKVTWCVQQEFPPAWCSGFTSTTACLPLYNAILNHELEITLAMVQCEQAFALCTARCKDVPGIPRPVDPK